MPEDQRQDQKDDDGLALPELRGADRQHHGETAAQQDGGVGGAEDGIQAGAGHGEDVGIQLR